MSFYQGMEILADPRLNPIHRAYIRLWGIPISGLRIRLRRILPEIQGSFSKIIDLGCGRGIFSFELAKRFPNAQVLGIDIEDKQIAVNNSITQRKGFTNLQFEAQDLFKLTYQNTFDLALTVDNLEHVEADVDALKRFYTALKPGGTLIVHVPAYERIWIFLGVKVNFDVPGHVRPGYRADELKAKVEKAGFTVDWIKPTYGYLETISNNLSYLITGADQKNAAFYALAFPLLNGMAWLGRHQKPGPHGAGLILRATKPKV